MTIRTVIEKLSLEVLCSETQIDREIQGGYASDMLSCVMAGAQKGNIWVTLLKHLNVIAVAVLIEIPAIILSENAQLEQAALKKADDEGIVVLRSPENTYAIVGKLYEIGIR